MSFVGVTLNDLRYVIQINCHIIHSQPVHCRSAFQRLGFAFEVLRSPCSRRTYDRTSKPPNPFEKSNFLQGEQTFRGAVEAFLREFMRGEFAIVRNGLQCLSKKYPHLVSQEVVFWVEKSFVKMRELVLTAKTYTLLIYAELGRLHRVQRRLRNLRLLDVMGRMKLTVHLVRVALAIPMRVDRALKQKEEEELMAKIASLQATGLPPDVYKRAGILNERVSRVLEFIVGDAGFDEESDEMDEINEPVKSASK
ncbi:MAG: hypothetical protein M1829_003522 [Trizodia sp. TS-e1964]|nr:MAG: hypothetical protein M1829_003522 [Trizodia sp. TS-e1964]